MTVAEAEEEEEEDEEGERGVECLAPFGSRLERGHGRNGTRNTFHTSL